MTRVWHLPKRSSTDVVSSPVAGQLTAHSPHDPADWHWVQADPRLIKERVTCLATEEPEHDSSSQWTHVLCVDGHCLVERLYKSAVL